MHGMDLMLIKTSHIVQARHDKLRTLIFQADEIYHLASPASPPHYMENPVKTIKTNTLGTINMLGKCHCISIKCPIVASSFLPMLSI